MGTHRIVVGADGSAGSRRAVEWAASLAHTAGATVIAVHALGLLHRRPDGSVVASDRHRDEIGHALEREWCSPLRDSGVEHRAELREGTPVPALLDACAELAADLLVVGRRGSGGFPGLLIGSTSAQLAQHAPCPVVIVPGE